MMSDKESLREKTVSGLVWRFAERCGAQGVSFIVSVVLARLIAPEYYGTIALVTVFTSILQVFVDSGMGNALIQKKNADDLDFSSVFYFNLVVCICLYGIIFVASPFIADFYGDEQLIPIVRVLSITILISGIKNIQQAYVSRKMLFKRFFFSTLSGTVGAAIVGIILALKGAGVWALVVQQLFNTAMDTVILWITVKWRPKLMFSWLRLKTLFTFGWKLLVSSLIDTLYDNIRQLFIGKIYSASDLAYYNKGKQMPQLIVVNLNTAIDSVLLPAMSQEQDNSERVKAMTRRAIKISSYIMWPLMIGLFVIAEPLVNILLTEKWAESVPYIRIFALTYAFWPIHTANLNALKALGRSDIFLRLEILKKVIGFIVLLCSLPFGVITIAVSLLITNIISSFINAYPNRKLLGYSYVEQMKDILPSLALAVVMGIGVSLLSLLSVSDFILLALQIILGTVIYLVGSWGLRMESFLYICEYIKSRKGKKS